MQESTQKLKLTKKNNLDMNSITILQIKLRKIAELLINC